MDMPVPDRLAPSVDADTLLAKAASLIDAGRVNAARPLFAAGRALVGLTPAVVLLGARIHAAEEDWPAALTALDAAIEAEPAHVELRKYRAEVRHRSADVEGAARDAAEAVVLAPHDARAKALLGAALLDLGLTSDAIACLKEAVASVPTAGIYREVLAKALERVGDPAGAFELLNEGIAADPGNLALRNAIIQLCIRRRDFLAAISLAEEARQSGIVNAGIFAMAGHSLSSLGRHEEAILAYKEALKLDPEDAYIRHLVAASGSLPEGNRAPAAFIRSVYDSYAADFEADQIARGYSIPGAIRSRVQRHPKFLAGEGLDRVLDLGCGTGLAALALSDLPIGSFTGIDLSPRMLDQARVKGLYADLREGDIPSELESRGERWPLILAADVICCFGDVKDVLAAVHQALEPGGWFIFSAEELLPDHDGVVSGNGRWALGREGRYSHTAHYLYEAACEAGFRVVQFDRPPIRQEAEASVPGLLLTLERMAV